jgi:hypothetical protein
MPVRDGARFLPQTWNTVRRSRGVRFEVLVVDDGSGDETPVLLEAWAREDHRLRWIRTEPGGIVNALNLGLSAARAPYVARLDADDLVHPDRLSRQYAAATGHGWMVVGSAVRCFPNHRITAGLRRYEDWQNGLRDPSDLFRERFVESPFVHPAVLMHRETVLRLGGYRSMGWPEDYDLWLRLFAAALPMGKVPETLTYWRDHAARLTRTAPDCTAAAITECKAAHLCSGPLAHCDRVFIAGTGDDAKRLARALARRGRPASGFLDINPRRIGQRIADVPVVTIEAVRSSLGPGALVLVAIGEAGRRDGLRRYFVRHGLHEPDEFLFVA